MQALATFCYASALVKRSSGYPVSQQPRPLSDLERYHARTVQAGLKLINALAMTAGLASLFFGLALPVAFIADGKRVPLVAILLLVLLTLFLLAAGAFLIAYARCHPITLARTATRLQGTLWRRHRSNVNAVTGGRHTLYIGFIDDIQLRWPYGADIIFDPLEGEHVELTVAMIEIAHREPWTRLRAWVGCSKARPKKVAVVLEYDNALHVHGALAKYGRHYLLRYHAGTALWAGALAALTLFVIMQPVTTDFLVSINFFLSLLAVVGYLAGLVVISLLAFRGYRTLRRRVDPGFDETPHVEKLKG